MRTKDVKIGNKRILVSYPTDWERINRLVDDVNQNDYSALDELIDLIIFYDETDTLREYIKLGAERGNDKARYVLALEMNEWNIQKVLTLRELAKKDVLLSKLYYEEAKESFFVGYGMITFVIVIALTLWHTLV